MYYIIVLYIYHICKRHAYIIHRMWLVQLLHHSFIAFTHIFACIMDDITYNYHTYSIMLFTAPISKKYAEMMQDLRRCAESK